MQPTKQQISTNNLIALLAVVSLIVVIACGLFGKSLVAQFNLNNKVIAKKKLANDTLTSNLVAYQKLHDAFDNIQPTAVSAENSLPNLPDFTSIASIIEGIAGRSGGSLKSITQSTTGTSVQSNIGKAVAVPFNISFEGSYANARSLLSGLEISSRPMSVQTAQVSGNNKDLKLELTIQSYYQPAADITPKMEVVK